METVTLPLGWRVKRSDTLTRQGMAETEAHFYQVGGLVVGVVRASGGRFAAHMEGCRDLFADLDAAKAAKASIETRARARLFAPFEPPGR